MGDQGLACGGVLDYLMRRDGLERWLANRYRLDTLYYGRDFGTGIDTCLGGDAAFKRISTTSVETSAKLLSEGGIVAIYTRGMEYGPRALGARTIMASALDARINQDAERPALAQRVHAVCARGDGRGCRDRLRSRPGHALCRAIHDHHLRRARTPGAAAFPPWCMSTARRARR